MKEEMSCPKCGGVAIKNLSGLIEFSCRSTIEGVYSRFIQTTICERKCELTKLKSDVERLRTSEQWLAHKVGCRQTVGWNGVGSVESSTCTCGLEEFKSFLKAVAPKL